MSKTRCCYQCGEPEPADEQFCPVCDGNYFVEVECDPEDLTSPRAAPGPASGEPPTPDPPPPAGHAPEPPRVVPPAPRPRRLTVMFTAAGQTSRHDVAAGKDIALGRDPKASPFAAAFAADDLISRRHAVITYGADGTTLIRDMYSVNGTYVNDEELLPGSQRPLAEGDRIRLGEHTTGHVRSAPAGPPGDTRDGKDEAGSS